VNREYGWQQEHVDSEGLN